MAPFFPSSFSCRRRRESHCRASPAPQNLALHLVQISSQPCFHPFPPFAVLILATLHYRHLSGSWVLVSNSNGALPFPPCSVLSCPVLSCPVLPCPALPGLPAALQMQSCSSYSLVRSGLLFVFQFSSSKPPSSPPLERIPWVWDLIAVASHSLQGHAHHSISDLGISGIMNGPNSSCPAPLPSLPCLPHGMACASARAR